MNEHLIERLRRVATICSEWDLSDTPPFADWSELMDEAADALEAMEEEDGEPWPSD